MDSSMFLFTETCMLPASRIRRVFYQLLIDGCIKGDMKRFAMKFESASVLKSHNHFYYEANFGIKIEAVTCH